MSFIEDLALIIDILEELSLLSLALQSRGNISKSRSPDQKMCNSTAANNR
jgi:hypothetical protein